MCRMKKEGNATMRDKNDKTNLDKQVNWLTDTQRFSTPRLPATSTQTLYPRHFVHRFLFLFLFCWMQLIVSVFSENSANFFESVFSDSHLFFYGTVQRLLSGQLTRAAILITFFLPRFLNQR